MKNNKAKKQRNIAVEIKALALMVRRIGIVITILLSFCTLAAGIFALILIPIVILLGLVAVEVGSSILYGYGEIVASLSDVANSCRRSNDLIHDDKSVMEQIRQIKEVLDQKNSNKEEHVLEQEKNAQEMTNKE